MKDIFTRTAVIFREKQLTAKLVSLTLAVILWGYLYNSKTGSLRFEAPVEFNNLPQGLVVSYSSLKSVSVTLDGKKDYLKNIEIKNLRPYVNLETPRVDEEWGYQININRQQIPDGISIMLSSDKVRLKVERLTKKKVRIVPVLKGELPEGYVAGRIRSVPDYVTVSGPVSVLDRIAYVNTEPINLDNVIGDIAKEADLKPDSDSGLEFSESMVKVQVTVFRMDELYDIEVPVNLRNYSHEFTHSLSSSTVKIYLRKGGRVRLTPEDIDISVNAGPIEKNMIVHKKKSHESSVPVSIIMKKPVNGSEIINYIPDTLLITSENNAEKQENTNND